MSLEAFYIVVFLFVFHCLKQVSFLFYRSHVVSTMAGEGEARLLKLQTYVHFLQRAKEHYISSPDEKARIAELIAVISCAGKQ